MGLKRKSLDPLYLKNLDRLLDEVFAAMRDRTLQDIAADAGLGVSTVQRIDQRVTRAPYLQTVYKLARAAGMDVALVAKAVGRRRRAS